MGDFLRGLIAECGRLRFRSSGSCSEALYHPQRGYYSRQVRRPWAGNGGLSPPRPRCTAPLARAVAAWAAAHRRTVAHGGDWHLIELGGGNGELAGEILRSLGWWTGRGVRYHLVEVSEGLRAAQRQRLDGWKNVRWHTEIGGALEAAGGRALIFSNEFVDAFPCVQLSRDEAAGSGWREVRVAWPEHAEHPVEVLWEWDRPPSPTASALNDPSALLPGQRVEVHFTYQHWLAEWLPRWAAGRLLTIDYGDVLPVLYHRRPRGTLRAYCRHQRFTGLEFYQRFGQQDLTADVNFTDLQAWGDALGIVTDRYGTQVDFLERWLPRRWQSGMDQDPTLRYLLDPSGVGGAFKVLEQVRAPRQKAA